MNLYLGEIKYRPNTVWFTINKLIQAENLAEAENKLKKWAKKNVADVNTILIVTEPL